MSECLLTRMNFEFAAIGKFSERNTPASKLRTGGDGMGWDEMR